MKYFCSLIIFIFSVSVSAKELHDVKMADEMTVHGEKLFLKGMGIREVSILSIAIRVYVGGLYTADPKMTCDKIIASNKPKVMAMSYIHHVSPSEALDAYKEAVEKNCADKCKELVPKVQEIKPFLPGVGSGDVMKIVFDSKGTEFQLNDKVVGHVDGADFSRVFISAFIGEHPPTQDLKNGLCEIK